MPYVAVGTENTSTIEIHYEDHGKGQPVILIHGYPLNGTSWEKQTAALVNAGLRVITYGVPTFLLKTPDNPEGVDQSVFDGIEKAVSADRYAFFTEFFKNFYNTDVYLNKRISEQAVQASWNVAASSSPTASLACVPTWHEDFRKDLSKIDVPALVLHGDADRILPINAAGARTGKLIKGARLFVVRGGPHCITWTHADEVNTELVNFLGKGAAKHAS